MIEELPSNLELFYLIAHLVPSDQGTPGKQRVVFFEGTGQGIYTTNLQVAAKCDLSIILPNITKYQAGEGE